MSRVIAVLMGILLVTAAVAGCGGGGTTALTRAEFRKQADAICASREAEKNKALTAALERLGREHKQSQRDQEKLISTVAVPPIAQMTDELSGLGAPEGEEAKVEAMVAAFEEELEKVEADPAGAVTGKVGFFEKADKLAKGFGLKACALI